MKLISVEQLSIRSQQRTLLEAVSFELLPDRPLIILGQTGAGKSILARALMGLLPQGVTYSGKIEIEGSVFTPAQMSELWGKKITMLPQEPWHALDPLMPAYDQIAEVYQYVKQQSPEQAFNHAMDDLTTIGLKESAEKIPGKLSGGMAQRLAVAAATAGGANIILADEPTKGLDVSRRNDVIHLLKQKAKGGGLIVITHDLTVARQLGGDVIVIKEGKVVEQGITEQVIAAPDHPYTQALIAADPLYWDKRAYPQKKSKPVLAVQNLVIGRHKHALTAPINLTLNQGEVVGVVGDSGNGKSTLGDTLLGLLPAISGNIEKMLPSQPHQWLKLFQDPPASLSSAVTLGTLLEDVVTLHRIERHKIARLMERLNLSPELLARTSNGVSGGELQRFSILRALLLEPVFLFADEPTSRLDPLIAKDVIELLVQLAREYNCAILLVSHDPELIEKRCDRFIHLSPLSPG